MDEAENHDPKGLSQLCASSDEGGGVALGDSFAIYSIVATSLDWSTTSSKYEFQGELISAASAVENVIPVLVTTENVFTVNIVSLPCLKHPPFNPAREISPHDSLPWFLINASKFSKHQIVGHKDIVESLLIILQRPWCVLELCCCDSLAISAIHRFAVIATKLNPRLYKHALLLLHQELRRRTIPSIGDIKPFIIPRISFADFDNIFFPIKEVYKELSSKRLPSHNSFWLRLISTCALYLGISCSNLVRILSNMTPTGVDFPGQKDTTDQAYYSSIGRMSHHCHSSITISTHKSVHSTRKSTLNLMGHDKPLALDDLEIVSRGIQFLLLIYRQVLQTISESLP